MGAMKKGPRKGSLDLALDGGDFTRKWLVLDNGVLWVHRDDSSSVAEEAFPLHDTEISCNPCTKTCTLAVKLGSGPEGRRRSAAVLVELRACSEEEYLRWVDAVLEAVQLWHVRRQRALRTLLPAAQLAPSKDGVPQSTLSGPTEGRMVLVQRINVLHGQVGELRARARRGVAEHGGGGDGGDLPRFLRRAIADTLDKMWRACRRVRTRVDATDALTGYQGVYDALAVLREEMDAFVTFCSLLRDAQEMLGDSDGDVGAPFSPIRSLLALRDDLARLGPLVRDSAEGLRHRTALADVDVILQRCWTEVAELGPLGHAAGQRASRKCSRSSGSSTEGTIANPQDAGSGSDTDDCAGSSYPASFSPPMPAPDQAKSTKGGPRKVCRLASRLQRDVVRLSVRRARQSGRTEGQSLLHDALEMTALPSSPPTDVADDDRSDSSPHLGLGAPDDTRRRQLDSDLLRRRRLVRSAPVADEDDEDEDHALGEDLKSVAACSGERGRQTEMRKDTSDMAFRVLQDEQEDVDDGALSSLSSARGKDAMQDIPVTPATPNGGGRRALWCETVEVQTSGLLDRMNTTESALQEAKFEVLSSEESYLRSLDMLAHRVQCIEALQDPTIIADHERDAVSKLLDSARASSLRFVGALRALWSQDMMLRGLCSLMHKEAFAGASLPQYVHIVTLQPRAASVLNKIGSREASQLVPLLSLPAQRVSRLPLLLAAILRRLDQRTSEAVICRAALDRLNQIVFECNEALRRAEHTERMVEIGRALLLEKAPRKTTSWQERKSSVIGRAKSFFLKKHCQLGTRTSKVLTSTSSMLNLS